MDLDQAYLEAAMPTPARILNQKLKAYSLGHEYLLRRFVSPFVTYARIPTIEDLYNAVFICTCDFDEAQAELVADDYEKHIVDWVATVGPLPETEVTEIAAVFQEHVHEGSKCPKFKPIYDGGIRKKPGAPLLALILRCLTSVYHFTKSEAMNLPYGWAQWLYLTQAEQERKCRIVTQCDEDSMAAIREEMNRRGWVPLKLDTSPNVPGETPDTAIPTGRDALPGESGS